MVERIYPTEKTLGEFIKNHYEGFKQWGGSAPMDMDITHGIEVEGNDHHVSLYPFILWSDGLYKPCHYWGSEYYIMLDKC